MLQKKLSTLSSQMDKKMTEKKFEKWEQEYRQNLMEMFSIMQQNSKNQIPFHDFCRFVFFTSYRKTHSQDLSSLQH